jgi:hypothetical protein
MKAWTFSAVVLAFVLYTILPQRPEFIDLRQNASIVFCSDDNCFGYVGRIECFSYSCPTNGIIFCDWDGLEWSCAGNFAFGYKLANPKVLCLTHPPKWIEVTTCTLFYDLKLK